MSSVNRPVLRIQKRYDKDKKVKACPNTKIIDKKEKLLQLLHVKNNFRWNDYLPGFSPLFDVCPPHQRDAVASRALSGASFVSRFRRPLICIVPPASPINYNMSSCHGIPSKSPQSPPPHPCQHPRHLPKSIFTSSDPLDLISKRPIRLPGPWRTEAGHAAPAPASRRRCGSSSARPHEARRPGGPEARSVTRTRGSLGLRASAAFSDFSSAWRSEKISKV